jgi:hypothetical protein
MSNECKPCRGTGYKHEGCERCERDGWVEDLEDGGTMTCPECNGESAELCSICQGDGLHHVTQQEEIDRLTNLVIKGYAVVNDFMPNIGKCVIQDYQRLNEFCVEAAALTCSPVEAHDKP